MYFFQKRIFPLNKSIFQKKKKKKKRGGFSNKKVLEKPVSGTEFQNSFQ